MKYPVSWNRDRVTRVVILGGVLSPHYLHSTSDVERDEGLQVMETTDSYSIFKDKNGNITFVVKTDRDIIERIDPEVFTGIENVNEIVISGALFTPNSKAPLPDTILELPKLRSLILKSFDSTVFPKITCRLVNLENLQIRGSEFSKIPKEIGRLQKLHSLEISSTPIKSLPGEIGNLGNLTRLKFLGTQIKELPPEITQLTNLTALSVRYCDLVTLQKEICHLHGLKHLDISGNKITQLPVEIRKLKNLEELNVQENPLDIQIFPEILAATKAPSAILSFYFSRKTRPLDEIKMIVVGQGSVGKTSLVQRLVFNDFNPSEKTIGGVSIHDWQVDKYSKSKNRRSKIKIHLWDFDGEESLHSAHQAFLTQRSLYLLVLDSRLTLEENRIEYWLEVIHSCGSPSPVLAVCNKTDLQPFNIDLAGLSNKYPRIAGVLKTSASTGEGIEELKTAITEQINKLPVCRIPLPQTWSRVKTKLEELVSAENIVPYEKYLDLCAEHMLTDETSQRTLIGFLHDLGVLLYFQGDPRFEAIGILNPQWVMTGIYKILNSRALIQNKGVLTGPMLGEILYPSEYPPDQRSFIVNLMRKFELCAERGSGDSFLVPGLLPKDEPAGLNFDGVLGFEYEYSELLSCVLPRFIVRMEHLIHENYAWRAGVMLKIGKNLALIKADTENRKIRIFVNGPKPTHHDALSIIRIQFDDIHNSINGSRPRKRVPAPGALNGETVEYGLAYWFKYGNADMKWLGH